MSSDKIRWTKPWVSWNIQLNTGEWTKYFFSLELTRNVNLRQHNPILSASSESYSALGQRKSYQTSNFINAARTEDGTTFYMRQTFHN